MLVREVSPATYEVYSLQANAKHPDTFAPHVISLQPSAYVSMVRTMNLPYRGIESTSAVGPIFWAAYDQDEQTPHLRMSPIYVSTSLLLTFIHRNHKPQKRCKKERKDPWLGTHALPRHQKCHHNRLCERHSKFRHRS
jgi:hypothetical protein